MSNQRFEQELRRVIAENSSPQAPTTLRLRVARVPDELSSQSTGRPWISKAASFAIAALLFALVGGSLWLRYSSITPDEGGNPSIMTGTPVPSGVAGYCSWARLEPVRMELSGSEVRFASVATGKPVRIVWPAGFSARIVNASAERVASDGTIVAHEGDTLTRVGGGYEGGAFHVCMVGDTTYGG